MLGLSGMAEAVFTLMRPVLAITDDILAVAFELAAPSLGANDRFHVATCHVHGIPAVLTADQGFDAAPGGRRLDPPISVQYRRFSTAIVADRSSSPPAADHQPRSRRSVAPGAIELGEAAAELLD